MKPEFDYVEPRVYIFGAVAVALMVLAPWVLSMKVGAVSGVASTLAVALLRL